MASQTEETDVLGKEQVIHMNIYLNMYIYICITPSVLVIARVG